MVGSENIGGIPLPGHFPRPSNAGRWAEPSRITRTNEGLVIDRNFPLIRYRIAFGGWSTEERKIIYEKATLLLQNKK